MSEGSKKDVELGSEDIQMETISENPPSSPEMSEGKLENLPIRDDSPSTSTDDAEDDNPLLEYHDTPSSWLVWLEIVVVCTLLLLPALILYLTVEFDFYDILAIKGGPTTNQFMEFIRYSIYISAAYGGFVFLNWLVGTLPAIVIGVGNKLGFNASVKLRRHVGYLRAIHKYVATAIFFIYLAGIGSVLIYRTTLFKNLISYVTMSATDAKPAATAAAAASDPQAVSKTLLYYMERGLLVLSIYALVIGAEKYLIEVIAMSFHRMAFSERIKELNFKFSVISTLYRAVSRGRPHVVGSVSSGDVSSSDNVHLTRDTVLHLTSAERAKKISESIFRNLCPSDRQSLQASDFSPYFPPEEYEDAFLAFDANKDEMIEADEFNSAILDMFVQRENVKNSLQNNGRIVKKLDNILIVVAIIIASSLAVPIYDVGVAKAWATFGIIMSAFGFLFQNAGKTCFEALLFVFVEHAFDVGDRVVIDDKNLVVKQIDIFTTIFVQWDGQLVYSPNSSLSGKNIYNVRRSGFQSENVEIVFSGETSTEMIWKFRDAMIAWVKQESRDFSGYLEIANVDVLDSKKIKIQLIVQYRANFQDLSQKSARKNKLMLRMKEVVHELGIETV